MHEMSLVQRAIELVMEEMNKANARAVQEITIEIGECAGVEDSSLWFAWDVAVVGTMLEQAKRRVQKVEGLARCNACGVLYELHHLYDPCKNCNSFDRTIIQGDEFRIKSLVIE
ncbi:MAG: hydrogenase maturation nickel metallochaperone HypA [Cyclobacteriaceae bacterium]